MRFLSLCCVACLAVLTAVQAKEGGIRRRLGNDENKKKKNKRFRRRGLQDESSFRLGGGIVGGVNVDQSRYPYFVLLEGLYEDGTFYCGGALIRNDLVLSAGHCGDGLLRTTAFVNYTQEETTIGLTGNEFVSAAFGWIVHPDFSRDPRGSDIMVIKLMNEAPPAYTTLAYTPAIPVETGNPVRVLGFGETAANTGMFPDILQQGDVEIIDTTLCNSETGYNGGIDEVTSLCAGIPQEGGVVRRSCLLFVVGKKVVLFSRSFLVSFSHTVSRRRRSSLFGRMHALVIRVVHS